jgi:hypothetical protein
MIGRMKEFFHVSASSLCIDLGRLGICHTGNVRGPDYGQPFIAE